MRFMVIVRATADSESGAMPSEELLTQMGQYNEQLLKAGVLVGGEGLHPSSKGARVRFSGTQRSIVDGPFAETKELIAGYWLFETGSLAEAIEWVKRAPNLFEGKDNGEVEIRQVCETEDFGPELTPELRAQEDRLRAQLGERR